jgi:hypothetical protein
MAVCKSTVISTNVVNLTFNYIRDNGHQIFL